MAKSTLLRDQIKARLFELWLPNREGGLSGLIDIAALVVHEQLDIADNHDPVFLGELQARIEFLEGELYAYENPGEEEDEAVTAAEDAEAAHDAQFVGKCDCDPLEGQGHIEDCPMYATAKATLGRLPVINDPAISEAMADLETAGDEAEAEGGDTGCTATHLEGSDTLVRLCLLQDRHEGDHDWHPELAIDQTKYRCPQCGVVHKEGSAVFTAHAHLLEGRQGPTPAQRAMDRREPG